MTLKKILAVHFDSYQEHVEVYTERVRTGSKLFYQFCANPMGGREVGVQPPF